jgi:hypothetical protein
MSFSSALATARVAIPLSLIAFITMQAEPRQVSSPSVRDQVTADESSCVATLRVINVAQATYWGGDPPDIGKTIQPSEVKSVIPTQRT